MNFARARVPIYVLPSFIIGLDFADDAALFA